LQFAPMLVLAFFAARVADRFATPHLRGGQSVLFIQALALALLVPLAVPVLARALLALGLWHRQHGGHATRQAFIVRWSSRRPP